MPVQTNQPTRKTLQLDFSDNGHMRMSGDDARHFFPEDTLLALWRDDSLVLLPTRGAAAGGLVLKQRNLAGDRSILVSEVFDFQILSAGSLLVGTTRLAD